MGSKREVSREEFYTFLDNYERRLERDVCDISEPPLVTYNDFTLGNWPESIVASYYNFAGYGRPNAYYIDHEELDDQCRINGMGAERELALMGEVQRLRKELAAANDEIAHLRGPLVEYKRGFGPGDGDSAALTETGNG